VLRTAVVMLLMKAGSTPGVVRAFWKFARLQVDGRIDGGTAIASLGVLNEVSTR
jgi:hypothetical protein